MHCIQYLPSHLQSLDISRSFRITSEGIDSKLPVGLLLLKLPFNIRGNLYLPDTLKKCLISTMNTKCLLATECIHSPWFATFSDEELQEAWEYYHRGEERQSIPDWKCVILNK